MFLHSNTKASLINELAKHQVSRTARASGNDMYGVKL